MRKVLAIGNSFSVDALFYFSQIAEAAGEEVSTLNLYIGGCSLQQHADNLKTGERSYICYLNGKETDCSISIAEALRKEHWDIVTIQQASHDSGIPESYEPYGTELLAYIRENAPQAEVWFHKTWAYEQGSDHPDFPRYDCDQVKMYQAISKAAAAFTQKHMLPVIPSGDVIQALRRLPEFDFPKGGQSLCRDGFHLSETYGRYAAAAAWFEKLLRRDIRSNAFIPEGADQTTIDRIKQVVHMLCEQAVIV